MQLIDAVSQLWFELEGTLPYLGLTFTNLFYSQVISFLEDTHHSLLHHYMLCYTLNNL